MTSTLLELCGVSRAYASGDETIVALNDINLSITAGEMVALVGPSGSGKSTLMNILGCLDRPTTGRYRISGKDTRDMSADWLAQLRSTCFGFIFQRYHLLPDMDALSNVAVPAVYAGGTAKTRRDRAQALLDKFGIGNRSHHRPSQLSGGQQQRVSIARALMNGGHVILADEPTGALDRCRGQEVMDVLKTLHSEGHTVIIVTHDMQVAAHAQRIIEINDGEIIADRPGPHRVVANSTVTRLLPYTMHEQRKKTRCFAPWTGLIEAGRMAWLSMRAHRLRSFLTMLGIIIGIASVVAVVALGEGSRKKVLEDINGLGTDTIVIYPGRDYGDMNPTAGRPLDIKDAEALAEQPYADSVTPEVVTSVTLRYRDKSLNAGLKGVGERYFQVHGLRILEGGGFSPDSVKRLAQEVVIDHNARRSLFGADSAAIGQVVMLGSVPFRVVGVARDQGLFQSGSLNLWVPYTTALTRIIGPSPLQSLTVRVRDSALSAQAEQGVTQLLYQRHGSMDFFVQNNDDIRKAMESTTATMTLLGSMIALISLVVGGIGVMNIMLVSVAERIPEIGVRMAVGARPADIMKQFLIEAVLVCLIGGVLGILLAFGFGAAFSHLNSQFRMDYSPNAVVTACACSTLIGLLFGYLPARKAARLDPVDALARE